MSDVSPEYAVDNPPTDTSTIEIRDSGLAIKTAPDAHVGQVHITRPDGTIDNFVGPQISNLVKVRDGGPYLDEVEAAKEDLRRRHVLDRQQVTAVDEQNRVPESVETNKADETKSESDEVKTQKSIDEEFGII